MEARSTIHWKYCQFCHLSLSLASLCQICFLSLNQRKLASYIPQSMAIYLFIHKFKQLACNNVHEQLHVLLSKSLLFLVFVHQYLKCYCCFFFISMFRQNISNHIKLEVYKNNKKTIYILIIYTNLVECVKQSLGQDTLIVPAYVC